MDIQLEKFKLMKWLINLKLILPHFQTGQMVYLTRKNYWLMRAWKTLKKGTPLLMSRSWKKLRTFTICRAN